MTNPGPLFPQKNGKLVISGDTAPTWDLADRATYHTCGGMMHLLDLIVQNGADASETLAPPGMGATSPNPGQVRAVALAAGFSNMNRVAES